ncbi:hypothetical protein EXIGLDRAFT_459936 [Exidia glandulosa HHB12029]|uniref:Uncharacterized protein n=1 Tax=Exidia glandulosa HHB12029 TaxID=1314781 RepID=A0A165K5I7_EXIGL|nr:hypothetical protein EXIGLDRAFT_79791 [Exidia glandulosa HHB12029]KZV95827.1 hypothetical protein EXIGLDRAFT_459936 [Exidia glandulosa HHB12029]
MYLQGWSPDILISYLVQLVSPRRGAPCLRCRLSASLARCPDTFTHTIRIPRLLGGQMTATVQQPGW